MAGTARAARGIALKRRKRYAIVAAMTEDTAPDRSDNLQPQDKAMPLRPLTLWLPDTRAPGFAAEARRQSQHVSKGCGDDDLLQLLEDDLPWSND